MKLKKLWFMLHQLLRYCTLYGWVVNKNVLVLQYIVLLSWNFNNNKCLVSQLEKYLFGETFMGNSVYVNKYHRNELYIIHLIGVICYYIKIL